MTRPGLMTMLVVAALGAALAVGAEPVRAAGAAADTMRLSVMPSPMQGQAGDTILVELKVPVAGPAFNAYDAYLAYDPASLQFLPAASVATQEGPLMTAACGLRFHVFEADTLSGRLRISHSLLCAGRSVTGPGVVYRVKLRCRAVNADTHLDLLLAAPQKTVFYLAGTALQPLATTGAIVRVGNGSATATAPPRATSASLRVVPNPFNPRASILFTAPVDGPAVIDVVALDGRRVRRLWDGSLSAGEWRGTWDGRDDAGRPAAAGVYLVTVRGEQGTWSTRAALVR